jgi:site-specific recombinase XerD
MTALRPLLAEYLETRRAQGLTTARPTRLLSSFVAFVEAHRGARVTTAHALAWATQPAGAHPGWWAQKLSTVRVFARHVHLIDPRHEIPAVDLLPARFPRSTPVLYSPAEIRQLLQATRSMPSPFRGLTHETLFGLLAATGLRVGEAIRLDACDVDWGSPQRLVIRESKCRHAREVVLHATVVRALRRYASARERVHPTPRSPSFFVSLTGTRLLYTNVQHTFAALRRRAGITRPRARIHDLRHTFAVQTLMRWHRDGADVDARMPRLSTYLGHRHPASTYWYLTAAPELMALVGRKLQRALGTLP